MSVTLQAIVEQLCYSVDNDNLENAKILAKGIREAMATPYVVELLSPEDAKALKALRDARKAFAELASL